MKFLRAMWKRMVGMVGRGRQDEELAAELEAHLQFHVEDNVRAGMTPQEARRHALIKLGGMDQTKEAVRARRTWPWAESVEQDVRFALRMMRKNPGFTTVAVLTLALGIGANTAIFSVIDAVLLRSLPYPNANRLVVLNEALPRSSGQLNVSLPDFLDWQAQSHAFDQMAAYSSESVTLTGTGDPAVLRAGHVSWSFFPLLGVKPLLGRTFTEAEDKPGAAWAGVVISYSFWRNKLEGDANIIGKAITLDGSATPVVGVLPPGFRFPGLPADVFTQMGPLASLAGYANRSNHPGIRVLARLKAGESLRSAGSDMATIMVRLSAAYPQSDGGERAIITPLYSLFLGKVQPLLFMLFGAAGLVLLLACVNVSNLFVSRGISRQREVAMRAALGAGRMRLVRQLLTESILFSVIGGAAGTALAFCTIKPLLHLAPRSIPNIGGVQLNLPVLLFTIFGAALTGIVFGLAPSLQTTRPDLNQALKQTADVSSGGKGTRLRAVLVVSEIAVAMTLVIGSGLLIRSFASVLAVDPGFNADHVLALDVLLSGVTNEGSRNFYNEALKRILALPGVESAAAVMQPPVAGTHWTSPYMVEGGAALPVSERPWTVINMTTTDYFRTMQTRLLEGRFFTEADHAKSHLVIIINRTFAERLWPGESAIGKRIYAQGEWREVVGVVADLKQYDLAEPAAAETFLPFEQMPVNRATIVVRTSVEPGSMANVVTGAIQNRDADLPVSGVVPLTDYIATSVASRKFSAWLVGVFGALALLLAAIGTYATTAYSVSLRVRELGIRMALGADRANVLKLILGGGMRRAVVGIAIGAFASLGLTQLISNQLYGVRPYDPITFAGVAVLLFVVAALACYVPARRAMRIDPVSAMRCE